MLRTRRHILASFSAVGGLAAINSFGLPFSPQVSPYSQGSEQQSSVADQATYDFWSKNVRDPDFGRTRSLNPGSAPRATFVYYDKLHGFVSGSDIGDTNLPDKGDLNVIVNVDHIHTSTADQARFVNLDGGSLRIDLQQTIPFPSLAERLAWTSLAGFLPENKKLPPLKEMTFDPGTTWGKLQTVPLPGGGGRWTWNFFLQHRKSHFMQLFDMVRRGTNLVAPIFGLGLPAIAITALNTVDNIVAELTKDANTDWLFQSPDIYFYATKEARDMFVGSKFRLRQGMYVIVPSDQLAFFSKQAGDLEIKDGLIVPKNTKSLDVLEAAKQTIPNVTYLTIGVTTKLRPPSH